MFWCPSCQCEFAIELGLKQLRFVLWPPWLPLCMHSMTCTRKRQDGTEGTGLGAHPVVCTVGTHISERHWTELLYVWRGLREERALLYVLCFLSACEVKKMRWSFWRLSFFFFSSKEVVMFTIQQVVGVTGNRGLPPASVPYLWTDIGYSGKVNKPSVP